ncbi:MAG: ribonuclease H [Alphaproteobacteria bacterium]|nr:ribonuclease H [Alphaproteobacteria bacterium]
MHAPVRIWLEVAHHPAFRVGGWAFVRRNDGEVSGTAGGERRIDPERTALAALAAALRDLPPGASVDLHASSSQLLAIPARISAAEAGQDPPAENLDLWAQVATALRGLDVRMSPAEVAPHSGSAFAAAWADFACDRAKDKGAFTAAIPRSNLAKAGI